VPFAAYFIASAQDRMVQLCLKEQFNPAVGGLTVASAAHIMPDHSPQCEVREDQMRDSLPARAAGASSSSHHYLSLATEVRIGAWLER